MYINVLSSSNALAPNERDKLGLSLPELSLGKRLDLLSRYYYYCYY